MRHIKKTAEILKAQGKEFDRKKTELEEIRNNEADKRQKKAEILAKTIRLKKIN